MLIWEVRGKKESKLLKGFKLENDLRCFKFRIGTIMYQVEMWPEGGNDQYTGGKGVTGGLTRIGHVAVSCM